MKIPLHVPWKEITEALGFIIKTEQKTLDIHDIFCRLFYGVPRIILL